MGSDGWLVLEDALKGASEKGKVFSTQFASLLCYWVFADWSSLSAIQQYEQMTPAWLSQKRKVVLAAISYSLDRENCSVVAWK